MIPEGFDGGSSRNENVPEAPDEEEYVFFRFMNQIISKQNWSVSMT